MRGLPPDHRTPRDADKGASKERKQERRQSQRELQGGDERK